MQDAELNEFVGLIRKQECLESFLQANDDGGGDSTLSSFMN